MLEVFADAHLSDDTSQNRSFMTSPGEIKEKILKDIRAPVMGRLGLETNGELTEKEVYLSGIEHPDLIWDTYDKVSKLEGDELFELAQLDYEFKKLQEWRKKRRKIRLLEMDDAAYRRFRREIDEEKHEISLMEIETVAMKKETDMYVRRQVSKRIFMLSGYTAVVDFMNNTMETGNSGQKR